MNIRIGLRQAALKLLEIGDVRTSYRLLGPYMKRNGHLYALLLLLVAAGIAVNLLSAWYLQAITDHAVQRNTTACCASCCSASRSLPEPASSSMRLK
jgi:hypothetical protein